MLRLGMQILYADKKSSKNRNNAVVENVVEEYDFGIVERGMHYIEFAFSALASSSTMSSPGDEQNKRHQASCCTLAAETGENQYCS